MTLLAGGVAALGLDETSFLKATRVAPTRWITGLVDLERGRPLDLDVVGRPHQGRGGRLAWRPERTAGWPRSARSRWTPGAGMPARRHLASHATVVVDHLHAIVGPWWRGIVRP